MTLIAPVGAENGVAVPAGYMVRPVRREDIPALGRLYFASYAPGDASATLEEAEADIQASFDGEYGGLVPEASLTVAQAHGNDLVAAILTVRRAPWDGTPDCPFVIELFTDRSHRRRGLARALLDHAMAMVREAGEAGLALRVDADNTAARALYLGLGFAPWSEETA